MTSITAAVVRAPASAWSLETLELDEPRDHELLVRIVGVGICHTDLSIRDQYLPLPMPIVLGHEGAGVVERVGCGVTRLKPGDHIVLAPLSCGGCTNCQSGMQVYCADFLRLNIGLQRFDGSSPFTGTHDHVFGAFFGQSSFATHALVHQRSAIKVASDVPLEILGPLGCGVQTGAGTVMNSLRPRPGASLAVFGTGAVGLSSIMAAHVVGCTTIIAIDINPLRLQLARELGATHTIDSSQHDAMSAIREHTRGRGVNYSIDTTAQPAVIRAAVECLRPPGVCAVVGLARAGTELSLDINTLGNGRTVRGVTEGESVPIEFIPALIELWRQGRFPFDRLIRRYDFADINQAAADIESGATVKPVLTMP